jgi:protein-S-isoprenylcysteine O-methyltransferase Ste14
MNAVAGTVLTLLAVVLWGVLHSLLAAPPTKQRVRRRFGPNADRGYRLFYNGFAAVTLLPVFAIPARVPGLTLYQIPSPWVFLTTALQMLALLAIAWVVLKTGVLNFLGFRQLLSPHGSESARLQVSGFYRWVRHPLYTAGLVFIWLSPVMTTSTLALYLGLTLYIVIGSRYEERQLVAEFGESYLEYRLKVPALIPRPGRRY